ncbi:unnamed protein product [Schistosoma turkestanicum]|nr:unnamed protein product [Schistosoma turkestanicum]
MQLTGSEMVVRKVVDCEDSRVTSKKDIGYWIEDSFLNAALRGLRFTKDIIKQLVHLHINQFNKYLVSFMVMELKIESKSEEKEASTTVSDINQPLLIRGTNNTETVNSTNIDLPSTSHHGPVIQWAEGTVDNEFMGKKKSNCCCIYAKPRKWNESSSSSSSSDYNSDSSPPSDGHNHVNNDKSPKQNTHKHTHCTEHCRGHTKRCFRKKKKQDKDNDKDSVKNSNFENFEKPINQPSSTDDYNPNGS